MASRSKTVSVARAKAAARHTKPPNAPPRLDATNLAGLTSLMNIQNLRPNVDLEKAEKSIMGREGASPNNNKTLEVSDPVQLYTKELNELADELGIDFLDSDAPEDADSVAAPTPTSCAPAQSPRNPLRGDAIDSLIGGLDLESGSEGDDADESTDSGPSSDETGSKSGEGEESDGDDKNVGSSDTSSSEGSSAGDESGDGPDSKDSSSGVSAISNLEKNLGIDLGGARRRDKRRRRVYDIPVAAGGARPRLRNLTEEQERRRHINAVMGDMRKETRTSFGVEHERVQDVKASKLEQIGQLRMTLEEEGVDCSGVGAPTMASPVEEIDSVLTILKLKNDRNRYSSLAEEVILGFAEGIETVFDGTREIPVVGWKPDYTGYHNTVNVKLHRMRFETSQVVGNIIEKYHIGPTTRIIMELLPSFFLYPRQQRKQRGAPGLYADFSGRQLPQVSDAGGAYSAIRRADAPDSISTVSNI
ncbi:BA71V-B407L [Elysia marginata]|uniref:BA71V-B407L n=1 Tax=Elysia marginata TaxID=1093978 RepID=A0AAV4GSI1_9GAST|nr:BA71V-B407L [Elysia marginata]